MKNNEKKYFRSLVFHHYKKGSTINETFQELKNIYKNDSPSRTFITKWVRRFKLGQIDFKDDARSGRPSNTEKGKYDSKILELIETEPRAPVFQIAKIMGSSMTKARKYVKEILGYKKLSCKWVPHQLNEKQKKTRVNFCEYFLRNYGDLQKKSTYNIVTGDETWISTYDPHVGPQSKVWTLQNNKPLSVCRKSLVNKKVLSSVFFSRTGIETISFLEGKEKATAKWYKNSCLTPLVDTWRNKHPKSGTKNLKINFDNAPIHKSLTIASYINQEKLKLLDHPPYSPDLAPCDFWLFPMIKQRLKGKKYDNILSLKSDFENALKNLGKKDFDKCFNEWIKRCKGVIENNGDYY